MTSEFSDKKGKEILQIIELVANEKSIDKTIILSALESALAAVIAKGISAEEDADIRVEVNPSTGIYTASRYWEVVEEVDADFENRQISLAEASEQYDHVEIGSLISEDMPVDDLSRVGASQAKQIIIRLVRDAEREKMLLQLEKRVGEVVSAQVKKVTRDGAILELYDGTEALMKKSDMIPKEIIHPGDRIRAYLKDVNREGRGPLILLSRSCVEFMLSVFRIEVPEVDEGQIEIKSAARDPGHRAKIAVKSKDNRVDPIGACVGMRGARVQAISNDLNGERIDIILWDDNIAQLVVNALSPAEVLSVVVDEESRSMDVAVTEDQLSQAIGRNGQNIRLASELTNWSLNVMTQEDMLNKNITESEPGRKKLADSLGVDDDLAEILLREGYVDLDVIAKIDESVLAAIEEFDEEIASEIISRAKDALLSDILFADSIEVADDLLAVKSLSEDVAKKIVSAGIDSREKLADCAVDDLLEIIDISAEDAGKIIMEAREIWFNENE